MFAVGLGVETQETDFGVNRLFFQYRFYRGSASRLLHFEQHKQHKRTFRTPRR